MSVLPYPPLHKEAKFVVLSDWASCFLPFTPFRAHGVRMEPSQTRTATTGWWTTLASVCLSLCMALSSVLTVPGYEKRRALNLECLHDKISFRDSFSEMLKSVHVPFEECKQRLQQSEPLTSPKYPMGKPD